MGMDYYQPLKSYIEFMVAEGTIAAADLDLLLFTDDIDTAVNHINTYISGNFSAAKQEKPAWWLLERS